MAIAGTIAYMITQYLRPQDWVPLFLNLPVVQVIAPLTILCALGDSVTRRTVRKLPQTSLLALFLVLVYVSNAVHGRYGEAAQQEVIFLKRAAVFLLVALAVNSVQKVRLVLALIVVLTTVLAVQAIHQAATGVGWAGQRVLTYGGPRVTWVGDWDGPNVLALVFLIGLALACEFVLGPYPNSRRATNVACAVVILWGLFLTNSRGGWLGLVVVVGCYARQLGRGAIGAIVAIAFVLLVLLAAPSRMAELTTGESSAHDRAWTWEQGLDLIRQNWLFGIGRGQFTVQTHPSFRAHNNYVEVAAETGMIGYFLWLSVMYLSIRRLQDIRRAAAMGYASVSTASLARGVQVATLAFAVSTFWVSMELDILFVLWGLAAALINCHLAEAPRWSVAISGRDAAAVVGLMLAILGVVYVVAVIQPL